MDGGLAKLAATHHFAMFTSRSRRGVVYKERGHSTRWKRRAISGTEKRGQAPRVRAKPSTAGW